MEEREYRQHSQRRPRRQQLNPGFVLYAVCSVIIVICFIIGGIQYAIARGAAKKQAEEEAAALAKQQEEQRLAEEQAAAAEAAKYDFTLSFMGDVNLDDSWYTMAYMAQQENGIYDCFSADLLERMQSADLFCVNSEFAFTEGGEPLDGKAYTFRSKPSNVSIYQTMGVDLVTLANNHIYDYGAQGLTDTLATLDGAGIAYVGAGENLADASAPYYVELQGKTIAFVNASCAETYRFTPEATEDSSGILLCYDTTRFLQAIREAKSNADFVIACVHWGTDYEYEADEEQRSTAKDYIDAGADVIIGTHSHCLQGVEYYNGKPIFYSLGSCWFNQKTLSTFLLELHFTGDGNGGDVTFTVVPAIQSGCVTSLTQSDTEWNQVMDLLSDYSYDVHFSAEGVVSEGPAPAETDETPESSDGEGEDGTGSDDGDTTGGEAEPSLEGGDEAESETAQG